MTRTAAAVLALGIVLTSCAGGDVITGDRRTVGVVSVVFSARPARVRVGQAVTFALKLVNNGGQSREVVFTRTQLYDFWVKRGSREVWRWSTGLDFDANKTTLTLVSQGLHTYTESWTPTEAGMYRVYGRVTSDEYDRPLAGRVIVE